MNELDSLQFAENIKYLREMKGLKQADMIDECGFQRTTWNGYEKGISFPSFKDLVKISDFFQILESDLIHTEIPESHLNNLYEAYKNSKYSHLKSHRNSHLNQENIQPIVQLNTLNESKAEYKTERYNVYDLDSVAAAGVAVFVTDEDKRRSLPTLHFPWLGPGIHIRIGVAGDSMHPTIKDGDKTISTLVTEPANLREGNVYVLVDKEEGIVCKRIYRHPNKNTLELVSDNDVYKPYTRHFSDIIALFRVSEVITTDLRPAMSEFQSQLRQIQSEMKEIRTLLPSKKT